MITLTRNQVRRLRSVFRRSVLGINQRGPIPPLVLRAEGRNYGRNIGTATWPSSTSSRAATGRR